MGKKIIEKGWLYEYEETAESQIINGYEVTGVRYVLGELFDTSCNKALICIGINPSKMCIRDSSTHSLWYAENQWGKTYWRGNIPC